jgi:uncharacterized membrane protein
LQNRNVIVAVVSGVTLILTSTGIISIDKADHINAYVNSALIVLVGLGIISDPESHLKNDTENNIGQ